MRITLQRVSQAAVMIENTRVASIGRGYLILLGIESNDTQEDVDWLARKVSTMRLFSDKAGKMNLSLQDIGGDIIVVSQFTLYASTKKGNRPGFTRSAHPDIAIPLYESFKAKLSELLLRPVQSGQFGADMQVSLINDGPVTICIDTQAKE